MSRFLLSAVYKALDSSGLWSRWSSSDRDLNLASQFRISSAIRYLKNFLSIFFCRAQVKHRSSYNSDCETGIRVTFQLFTRANKYYLLITRKRTPDPIINIHSLFTVLRINYLTGQRLARNMFRNWFYFFLLFLFRNMKVSRNSLKLCFETIKIFGK